MIHAYGLSNAIVIAVYTQSAVGILGSFKFKLLTLYHYQSLRL